ncbi:PTS sugar transporter subunit IIA [Enterococcus sp. AZ109]|uniref:PTS sugar transporter subunit IIA n=1 Tax=Enterococcus sp. AZ109 TaxID=2774634 RepID=UPI003F25CA77
MSAILLGSHGNYAVEALKSAEMIIGEQTNVSSFSLSETMDLAMTIEAAQKSFDRLEKEQGTLILVDLMGGTPANVATIIKRKNPNVRLLTGFNLPLLIETFMNRETKNLDELTEYLKSQFTLTLTEIGN